ncbi:MAG: PKD domain-containing protein [Candidatus Eisenbacteria bacterium]|uniref:PKD domain-containing protein n=1 Tax=Eiseniibacteriota bacterium TaxID=2212470 RepID=A0A849SQ26_UNCEI|nr:PKD domain-containing protein [Candidatus Eisenbacteria bacterium]
MFRRLRIQAGFAVLLAAIAVSATASQVGASITLPYPFWYFNAAPGTTFDTPTGIAFMPDGRLLVSEKRGRVYVIKDGTRLTTPLWQRENEVLNNGDKGLLDVAVDPDFAINRYVYLLYTVDPDTNGVDDNEDAFGRLTRYQVSATDPNVVDYDTRTVLMGRVWNEGPTIGSITHSIGSLRWGTDKTLLISMGDGAQFTVMDPGGLDPAMFGPGKANPYEDIGAFRAQDITVLPGKVLRIDPATGHGMPSNPFYDGNPSSNRSKVWAYGVRNPFRICVRPGSGSSNPADGDPGSVYVGDVGWETWEEVSVIKTGGTNLGWPCFEGTHNNSPYQSASPAHNGCGSVGSATNPSPFTAPFTDWHHANASLSSPSGVKGNSAIGGTFYTGVSWPLAFRGRLIVGDYGYGFMRVATVDANDDVTAWTSFAAETDGPVDMATGPYDGDLYYVSITTGEVRRIHYFRPLGGNQAPNAVAGADLLLGTAPLTVQFSSAASSDPDGDSLRTTWTFDDGSGSFLANPTHSFQYAGTYQVQLLVDDDRLNEGTHTVTIVVNPSQPFPATGTLDDFNRANGPLGASWSDPVHGAAAAAVNGNDLVQSGVTPTEPVWDPQVFGTEQEAYVRFDATTSNSPEQALLLKLQGARSDSSHIRVVYDARFPHVQVATFQPGIGEVVRGAAIPIEFVVGDTLGARAFGNGTVQVFHNGALIGTVSVGSWPYAASGGRIGLALTGALLTRLDDFGGGNFAGGANTAPLAVIDAPIDSAFFAAQDSIHMSGSGVDAQQPAEALQYFWDVYLHHNTHVHPNTFTSSNRNAAMVAEDHEDGTGVWYEVRLYVQDAEGLRDTARVDLFPEINLRASELAVTPDPPTEGQWATWSFKLRNLGRMPAPISRWRLVLGNTLLAEGDTLIAPGDSVLISATLINPLGGGSFTARATGDTLANVVETDESDNASIRQVEMAGSPVGVGQAPQRFALSQGFPNPAGAMVRFGLDLPRRGAVAFRVLDVQGREVWTQGAREFAAGHWNLEWPSRLADGSRAPAGLYLALIAVEGRTYARRIAVVR